MLLLKRLSKYLRPHVPTILIATVCMGGVAGLNALRIYLVKPLQDQVFMHGNMVMLHHLIWWVPTISIFLGLFSYAQNYLMASISAKAITDIRQELFHHVQTLSMEFFSAASTGKIVARFTNDMNALQQVIGRAPIYFIRDGLTAVANIGLIFYLNWRFALLTIAALPFSALIIAWLGKKLRRVGRKGQEQMGDLFSVIQENLHAAAVVKAYSAEPAEMERFDRSNKNYLHLSLRFAQADTVSSPLMELIGALILSLLLWKGGADVVKGLWTPGSFLAFIAYAVMTYRPLKNFAELNAQLQLGLASSERLFEVLNTPPSVKEAAMPAILPPFNQGIVYQEVSFRYPSRPATEHRRTGDPDRPEGWALRGIHLPVKAGEIVALVGSSGAGKSTIAQLLPRFYDPTSGRVTVDGHDLREISFASLRGQIGLVTQETLLFNESIRYNIAYGRPNASLSDVQAAAESANAHAFICRLPQGYDTIIGERGMRLSGGERQRLSIARALLKNPPILILDEATASLDAESERLVQEAIERLMEHRTALVIAHRLSTVRRADRIVVLERGQIIEEGTHSELIAHQGAYYRLHHLQVVH